MEEKVRQPLTKVVASPNDLSDVFLKHFGKNNGVDLNLPKRRKRHQPLDFNK